MPKRKVAEEYAVLGEKDCWQLYGLQTLQPAKFSVVVGKILAGKYALINRRMHSRQESTN
jgi:hypothetical protein